MSIVDAFNGVVPPAATAKKPAKVVEDRPVPAPPAADTTYQPGVAESEGPSRLARMGQAVAADWRGAWLWDAHGITIRNLWERRIPDLDAVPAANRGLWIAWCVYNHAALVALTPLLFLVWVLCHPARLIYAAPVAAPLITLWAL